MPIKMKDVFNTCENAEKVQWSISLGIIFDLAGEVCKKCNHGHFGLRKNSSFSSDGYFWKCNDKKMLLESFNT
jgi:hypothetical protein